MMQRATHVLFAAIFSTLAVPHAAHAQQRYPARPIDVIVPWGPGGGSDLTARRVAQFLEGELKVSFPVINVPGASGTTGITKLFTAPADGYTMGVTGDIYAPMGSPAAKWKLADFMPLAIVINQPAALFVAEGSRFRTWADVEKEARAKPDTIKVAMVGFGSIDEIQLNFLRAKGLKLVQVPFAKPGERYNSLLGGHVDLLYEQAGDVKSYLGNRQIRPILSFTAKRFPAYPDIATTKELGYDVTTPQFRWIFMRAGTDAGHAALVARALEKMAATPDYKTYLASEMADPASFVPAREATAYFRKTLDALHREAAVAAGK